uniref:Methyltransferase 8, tRNA N3-cytidine n=1 Tax=Strigops habroptila TaxID=2489341 RepID=A0A672TTH7_STRHB
MGSLNKMNFITRLSAFCLRKSKMQQRHQSSRRPTAPLGSRILTDPSKVFEHNMWDHMQWSQEEEENAKEKAAENSLVKVQWEDQDKYEREASKYWNEFYKTHKNNFFKDRNWLFLEFPEILPEKRRERLKTEERSSEHTKINSTNSFSHKNEMFEEGEKYLKRSYEGGSTSVRGDVYHKSQVKSLTDNPRGKNCGEELDRLESFPGSDATYRILEVGCGAGNSVFPILKVLWYVVYSSTYGFSNMKVLFSSFLFSSIAGARPLLQEVLSGLFYRPEIWIACRPQIMLVASVQDIPHTGQPQSWGDHIW